MARVIRTRTVYVVEIIWAVPRENQQYYICVMYRPDHRHIPSQRDRCIEKWFLKQKIHRRRNVYIRLSLCIMLRLIRFDTLRRVHDVGFSRVTAHLPLLLKGLFHYVWSENKLSGLGEVGQWYIFLSRKTKYK